MNNGVTNENQVNGGVPTPGEPQIISASDVNQTPVTPQTVQQPVVTPQPVVSPAPAQPAPNVVIAPPQEGPVDASKKAQVTEKVVEEAPTPEKVEEAPQPEVKVVKKSSALAPFLFLAVLVLGFYIYYSQSTHQKIIASLNASCSFPNVEKETTSLKIDSSLVQNLYHKVKTNIREDIANPELDNSMKLYLAYRLVSDSDKIDTDNCNLFNPQGMEPFICEVSSRFVPKTIDENIMKLKISELFGEENDVVMGNIQLGSSCIGGYQYVPDRGQFVQGYCDRGNAIFISVDKKVVEATKEHNRIVIKEEVKYHENEKISVPDYLKSGYYYYTFKLDSNNNYIYVSKTYSSKY